MTVAISEQPSGDWDEFVRAQAGASIYLQSGWSLLAREVFGHRTFFIESRDRAGALDGVLPVVQQRSLFGNFMTSVAFFNYGGALATGEDTAIALMNRARELAQERHCSYLELRDVVQRASDWPVRTDKASMILELPKTVEELGKQLGAKLRSQIKRADREAISVRCGGPELLDDFYDVFCRNMHELGTPVYPIGFLRAIVTRFPANTRVLIVYRGQQPAAAGFLVHDGARAEIPWAACRGDAKPLGFNMKLYWEALILAISLECRSFDFGRSTIDSGTYRFKKQWGAVPLQLRWYRWDKRSNSLDQLEPDHPGRLRQLAVSAWQRMPLSIANAIGPRISPNLPW